MGVGGVPFLSIIIRLLSLANWQLQRSRKDFELINPLWRVLGVQKGNPLLLLADAAETHDDECDDGYRGSRRKHRQRAGRR